MARYTPKVRVLLLNNYGRLHQSLLDADDNDNIMSLELALLDLIPLDNNLKPLTERYHETQSSE